MTEHTLTPEDVDALLAEVRAIRSRITGGGISLALAGRILGALVEFRSHLASAAPRITEPPAAPVPNAGWGGPKPPKPKAKARKRRSSKRLTK
jgi:hypothetical protein